jgi:predicted RNA-binding Zn-ribbon protein involved in translation (DUF1610 family)
MKSILLQELTKEFEQGLSAAQDPENAYLPLKERRKTTIYSDWFTRKCPECGLDFREGDMVKLCPKCQKAYHSDDFFSLNCWDRHFANGQPCRKAAYDHFDNQYDPGCPYQPEDINQPAGQQDAQHNDILEINQQFMKGLAVHWKSFGDLSEIKVGPNNAVVGQICQWCGSSIRPGDRVVKCPCGKCESHFHNDMYRQRSCWNEWNQSDKHNYCIQSGRRIESDEKEKGIV